MLLQLLINLILALVWMLLHDVWDGLNFLIGFIIGLAIIFTMRRFFPQPFYGKKVWNLFKLFVVFVMELYKSGIVVIRQITQPKLTIQPGIIKVQTKLIGEWELTTISCLLTLTPGSVVMEVDPEKGIMYVHAMDVGEQKDYILDTLSAFEKAILEVTR